MLACVSPKVETPRNLFSIFIPISQIFEKQVLETITENNAKQNTTQWGPRNLSFELSVLSYITQKNLIQTPSKRLSKKKKVYQKKKKKHPLSWVNVIELSESELSLRAKV